MHNFVLPKKSNDVYSNGPLRCSDKKYQLSCLLRNCF